MATQWQKSVKAVLVGGDVHSDHIICKKDGSVVVKHSYFYRHNNTADKWAARVGAALDGKVDYDRIDADDAWAQWPTTSYFVATVWPKGDA